MRGPLRPFAHALRAALGIHRVAECLDAIEQRLSKVEFGAKLDTIEQQLGALRAEL
jgi:hypothetical protein